MNFVSAYLRELFVGTPFGFVLPPRARPAKTAIDDGRTAALEILKRYISELTFYRPGAQGGSPVPFKIKAIHTSWPDHETALEYPSIVFIQEEDGNYDPIGLTALTLEESRDKFGVGTVLQQQSQYVETFIIQVNASLEPERMAILKGLEEALVPTEQMYGIRFRMPAYYDQTCTFSLSKRRNQDDPDTARHRRIGRMVVELTYNVVALVNYVELKPFIQVNVQVDEATGEEVVLDATKDNTQVNPP